MLANAILNSVSPLIENPILPLSLQSVPSSRAFLVLGLGIVFLDVDVDLGDAFSPSSALVSMSMTKGENIPGTVPPKHNEIGLWWWWNELGGNDDSSPPPIISDVVGLEGEDVSPIRDVGLEAPINDVGLEGGGEEDGEAGGDMFLRMAV